MKIILAVDGSPYTGKALMYLFAHRPTFVDGNELILVNACLGIPPHVSRHVSRELLDDYYRDEAAKVLDPVRAKLAELGIDNYTTQARHGHAATEIIQAAREAQAELIIMGTRGHRTLGRALMGSVATQVVAEAHMSVLLVQ